MIQYDYSILLDIKDDVDVGVVLDHMKGYLSSNGNSLSFSILDNMVILHSGNDEDLQKLKKYMTASLTKECSSNNWKAFSDAEEAFLLIESKEEYKVWIME